MPCLLCNRVPIRLSLEKMKLLPRLRRNEIGFQVGAGTCVCAGKDKTIFSLMHPWSPLFSVSKKLLVLGRMRVKMWFSLPGCEWSLRRLAHMNPRPPSHLKSSLAQTMCLSANIMRAPVGLFFCRYVSLSLLLNPSPFSFLVLQKWVYSLAAEKKKKKPLMFSGSWWCTSHTQCAISQ